MENTLHFTLKIHRQSGPKAKGYLETIPVSGIYPDMSIIEMLESLNTNLVTQGKETIAFDHDCHEGICGCCSLVINGIAHGHEVGSTVCQLYMRSFTNGSTIIIEPFRSHGFPIIKDLMVDRSAFDKIIAAGGFISTSVGSAPDAHAILVSKEDADKAMDAAQCIGCGACVAACPNGSAMLFVAAKVSQLALLPQGKIERTQRVKSMVRVMDECGFGACSNHYECSAACPKQISSEHIARLNREYFAALFLRSTSHNTESGKTG